MTPEQTLATPRPARAIFLSMRRGFSASAGHAQSPCLAAADPSALLSLCAPEFAFAATSRELFSLTRSINANVVKYAVRTRKDGRLDTDNPIEAYWLMLVENGRREELTWAERNLAYGFSVSAVDSQGCTLHLAACPERELQVRAQSGSFRAELQIQKQRAALQRIFVQVEAAALLPSVHHVEIYGTTATGQRVAERIAPRRVGRL